MQVGSLVVCIEQLEAALYVAPYVKWVPVGDSETVYTVRKIERGIDGRVWVLLEEGCIGTLPSGEEIYAHQPAFKEVQPPMSLGALMEEVDSFELFVV